jgi:Ca2+-binding RTX toxin-like protein
MQNKIMVFIDSRVADHSTLIAGLGADSELVWLDATQDGLQQMNAALADRRDLASIRILAHGRPGALWIGAGELTCDNVDHHAAELAAIGQALGIHGDVQIYGCEVGKGSDGRAFVRALAEAFGVPVGAASQPVGHADLGGDWRLDVGELRTPLLVLPEWPAVLALTVTPTPPTYPGRTSGEFQNVYAFAALRADGSVVTWGYAPDGGDSSAVATKLDGTIDATQVFSAPQAFAALRADGSLVTWGSASYGGDSSAVASQLDGTIDVTQVFSSLYACAALRVDGSVVTWGYGPSGGDSSAVASQLDGTIDVTQVVTTKAAFAALRADGSVVKWGNSDFGGYSGAVAAKLDGTIDVTRVFSTSEAFAALRADGSVVAWGGLGGDSSAVAAKLDGTTDVIWVFSNPRAFAALRADGSVVTWGERPYGGSSGAVASQLDGTIDVIQVFSTAGAFAALRADGSVVTWGDQTVGGYSGAVAAKLDGTIDVNQVFSNPNAFAALRADGSVVTWGQTSYGGNSSGVAAKLDGTTDVTQVFSSARAFAALLVDGSVVTWGDASYGGNSSAVASQLDGTIDVIQVFSTGFAFAALRADGSLVTWGDPTSGGNSSAVASQLTNVAWLATPFTDDAYVAPPPPITGTPDNDHLIGTASDDGIFGLAGNDTLDGGGGADSMSGGDGNDFYYVEHLGDVVSETNGTAAGGTDTVYSTLSSYTLGANVENGRLLGTGAANLTGNSLANVFYASVGNNVLNGSTGTDTVSYAYGVTGTTGITVSLALTTAQVTGGSGSDTLLGIENLTGSTYADRLTGNSTANILDGGAGIDTMTGGDGSDTYYVRDLGDLVSETNATASTGGTDTVNSTLSSYTLGANVENGRLLSTGAANLTGNTLANVLYAGVGNNVLNGSTGIDTVAYTYGVTGTTGVSVSLAVTTAQATGGSGSDTLIAIENLTGSNNNDNLTGNSAANVLDGGAGNDTLSGGSGIDTMTGGDGSDTYYVQDVGDLVSETNATTSDTDTVYSTLSSYTLGTNVENGRLLGTGAANLTGNSLANVLYAGVGNNALDGGTGTDTVSYAYATTAVQVSLALTTVQATGGSGYDKLLGIEDLTGSAYADSLTGNNLANVLDGGAGSDTMAGGNGSDIYYVRDVGDLVSETNPTTTGGNDLVLSTLSSYTLGTNVENGCLLSAGAANLTGNSLANVLCAGVGNNVLNGDTGIDTVSYAYGVTGTTGVTVSLALTTAQATGGSGSDTLIGIENLTGSNNNDSLTGNSAANVLDGGAGNDALDGGAANDTMTGGDGSDTYYVRDVGDRVNETNATTGGTDTVYSTLSSYTLGANVEYGRLLSTGAANLTGNSLNNVLYAGVGNNVLNGSTGIDTVSYAYGVTGTTGVTVSLAVTTAQATGGSGSDTLIGIENLTGSNNNDTLSGNSAANVLDGGAGNDTLDGGTGIDTMTGGDGSDTYYVRDLGDLVSETNATASSGGTDTVYSTLSSYTLGANVEYGRLFSTGAANLTGNSLNNLLYAGVGNNVLNGSTGTDTVSYAYGVTGTTGVSVSLAVTTAQATGGSGSDTLIGIENLTGSNNNDTLTGNSLANVLTGGLGKDLLIGGAGSDIFDFNALSEMGLTNTTWDVINDFAHGLDRIDLSTLDANAALAGNQAFSAPVVGGTFSGAFANAGDLYFDNVAHVLYGNTDADAAAEFAIQLVGVSTLTAADLYL